MKRRLFAAALAAALLLPAALAPPAAACVGRKLVMGSLSSPREAMVSRVLTILVHERTGTTVEMRLFPSAEELFAAAREGKVDIYVGYSGQAAAALSLPSAAPEEVLAAVKKRFDEEFNLVWGRPLGCGGRSLEGKSTGLAAPVVRKDTLKKFPALPRLLEKVGGRVPLDDSAVDELVANGKGGAEEKAARAWLREVKLI
jgi:osmoprotectant transport system substrate-binding protein